MKYYAPGGSQIRIFGLFVNWSWSQTFVSFDSGTSLMEWLCTCRASYQTLTIPLSDNNRQNKCLQILFLPTDYCTVEENYLFYGLSPTYNFLLEKSELLWIFQGKCISYIVSKVTPSTKIQCFSIIWRVLSHSKDGISNHFQNFSPNLNVDGRNKCRGMISCKISLFWTSQTWYVWILLTFYL